MLTMPHAWSPFSDGTLRILSHDPVKTLQHTQFKRNPLMDFAV